MRGMTIFNTEQELVNVLVEEIQEDTRAGRYKLDLGWSNVTEVIIQRFLYNAQTDPQTSSQRILHFVNQKWTELFPEIYKALSHEEIVKANSFLAKTNKELATELANLFLEKSNWPALFSNKTMHCRIKTIREYWQKNYSGLERIPFVQWKQLYAESMLETGSKDRYDRSRGNQFLKMREVEEQVYMRLMEEFLSWAKEKTKSQVSSADEGAFLNMIKLFNTPIRFQKRLLEDVNLALRSLAMAGTRFR